LKIETPLYGTPSAVGSGFTAELFTQLAHSN
jgi:hypothetical protein